MHRPRMISRGTAAAMSPAAPLATVAVPPSTSATSSTTARYSTVPWPRVLRMGEPCGGRRHGTTARLQRMCTDSAMAEPASVIELAQHDEVAAVDRHHLPVATAQRAVGPPAVLDEPRLADRDDLVAVDGLRPPAPPGDDVDPPRGGEGAGAGAHSSNGGGTAPRP